MARKVWRLTDLPAIFSKGDFYSGGVRCLLPELKYSTNGVRRSGIQLDLELASRFPLLRTPPEGFCSSSYKHATPNGVKPVTLFFTTSVAGGSWHSLMLRSHEVSIIFALREKVAIRHPVEKPVKQGLVRGVRRWDLVAITINGVIGAGIFGLPAKVFSLIGPYSLVAFGVCALVVTLIILCFAEVGSRFNETGGPYLYAREAFGPTVAFEVGWLMWLARLTAFAANCNLLVNYLRYFWPQATNSFWRP